MAASGGEFQSWAERNQHRDVERMEASRATRSSRNLKDLDPVRNNNGNQGPVRGREPVRNSEPHRSMSLSPTARMVDLAAKRAQYEQANSDYLSLIRREKSRRNRMDGDGPLSAKPSQDRLPPVYSTKTYAKDDSRPTASITPPPANLRASPTSPPSGDESLARSQGNEPLTDAFGAETETGYFSEPDEVKVDKKKRNRIRVIVRKRPLNDREGGEDAVEVEGNTVHVNATKLRVDLTEYQESHHYAFDASCDSTQSTRDVYNIGGRDLITTVFEGGSASCFAYGQTGSGKTHTMIGNESEPGMYLLAAEDIFARAQSNHRVFVSLYEIYCNNLFDLLNQRQTLHPREDANKRINICGLTWHEIRNVKDLLRVIDRGTLQRRTGSTSANEYSSRSHAVMTITLRDEDQPKFVGSLNVVDLAGSERAADTAANDKQTRLEGAEINKSLLALKECIRGLDEGKKHIQFRGSKLTEVLRDSFVGNSRTAMIATVGPSSANAEHTLNTLRYAFRVKGLSIDCPKPSKERNAPRPSQRSKSTDIRAFGGPPSGVNLGAVPSQDASGENVLGPDPSLLQPPRRTDREARRRQRRHTSRRTAGSDGEGSASDIKAVEEKLVKELLGMRDQIMAFQAEKQRDSETIQRLATQVGSLQRNNEMLAERMDALVKASPCRLPPLNSTASPGDVIGSPLNASSAAPSPIDQTEPRRRSQRRSRRKQTADAEGAAPSGSLEPKSATGRHDTSDDHIAVPTPSAGTARPLEFDGQPDDMGDAEEPNNKEMSADQHTLVFTQEQTGGEPS